MHGPFASLFCRAVMASKPGSLQFRLSASRCNQDGVLYLDVFHANRFSIRSEMLSLALFAQTQRPVAQHDMWHSMLICCAG